jgi:hypothetical protein
MQEAGMARDGEWVWSEPVRGRFACEVALGAATGPGLALCVRCPECDALAAFDAGAWLARGLGGLRLRRLEPKLRCLACGGRQGRFELWNARALPAGTRRWSAAALRG